MEARTVARIPADGGKGGWQYEPKWDGFRCIALREGDAVELWSKAGKPLSRYFPEVVANLRALPVRRFALDGELVVPAGGALSFDDLLQRIHPAASRIARLAAEHPALYVVFDLLVDAKGARVLDLPLAERRTRLEALMQTLRHARGLALSPCTADAAVAARWLAGGGGALDGVIAKRRDAPYGTGRARDAMQKVKRIRTADCVLGGFRWATGTRQVGSLLLGLYDDAGRLDHVGFCSGIKASERAALTRKLVALQRAGGPRSGFDGDAPGGPSRWSTERSTAWEPLPHALVVEVSFDHVSGGRFRHGTRLVRWRPDKAPEQCTREQLAPSGAPALALLRAAPAARKRPRPRRA
jgi:ATP-dependent DNA ligase